MAQHNEPITKAVKAKRLELTQATVTLNGEPAYVMGINRPFAIVTQKNSHLSAEWSWEAVERVIANGGNFKS